MYPSDNIWMNTLNKRYTLHIATEADSEAIKELYEANDFDGAIRVQFLRNPDVFQSLKNEGEKLVVLLLRDIQKDNRAIGMGVCIIRREYIHRKEKRIGYLTGLKILPVYRKKIRFIPAIYEYLNEQTKDDVDVYYTTILSSNLIAQKMLERKHTNMPGYHYHGDYTTYFFSPKCSSNKSFCLNRGVTEELKQFYREQLANCDFCPSEIEKYSIPEDMFFHLHDKTGAIVAACAVWNQQKNKQYKVSGYKGIYRIAPYLPLKFFGYPRFPKPSSDCNYLTYAFVRAKNNNPEIAEILIRKTSELFRKSDFLMLGLHKSNPLNVLFGNIRHVKYQSRFYTVSWDKEDDYQQQPDSSIGLEVGLL